MTYEQSANLMPVLILAFEATLGRMIAEMLALEGYSAQLIHTDAEACSLLDADESNFVVLMDNLHVHHEGRRFLIRLRHNPRLRARVKTVSMAVSMNNKRLRRDFGDVLDAYLDMPLTQDQLLDTLATL